MCRPVDCKTCGRTTWAGCGQHVASVQAQVPADQWCAGHTTDRETGGESPFRRLFGR
ncbi:hypothetical protein [Nocardioides daeguensis]|uniref:Uncharacterized protein n=1 Tax=Nocardioides daeguensis TaxID=908359 RepID=A0ABP6UY87_9ACTN|nr:hypothetical protein [Nocardioides daeguensis]MBV6725960.1 hypothetical protein [Nocardioides daeguensis]MCR1772524.1 hypothetical protein [Nocardioides daeguensis]